jgi:hypothetical protein
MERLKTTEYTDEDLNPPLHGTVGRFTPFNILNADPKGVSVFECY